MEGRKEPNTKREEAEDEKNHLHSRPGPLLALWIVLDTSLASGSEKVRCAAERGKGEI